MNRIEMLASLTMGSTCVCDIGCDHGYVLIQALTKYDCLRGIAADVAAGPLSAAKENIIARGLEDRIKLVLSDGFKEINEDFDTAVIAGMGAYLIQNIINDSLSKVKGKKLILEPNNEPNRVREYLNKNHFIITDEYAINDMDKYYEIIVAISGDEALTDDEILYGPILLKKKEPAFINHYSKKREMLQNVISQVKNDDVKKAKQEELNKINELILNN